MQHRKDLIVQKLGLIPVACGGHFKETFRSPETVQIPGPEGSERNVFSTIYYVMSPEEGGKNYLHSNKSDTIHYFHDGWPAFYILVSPEGKTEEHILGRDVTKGHVPQVRVPGGYLKCGKILVDEKSYASFPDEIPFTLMSEEVAPGFDSHRRTPGTFGPGGAVTLLPEKFTQCPKACVVQTHSNCSKNKNVHISEV